MMTLEFAMGRLQEFYMGNQWLFICASDMEMVSYATQWVAKALAEGPH